MAFFRDRAWPFFLSVLVHATIVGLLIYGVVKFSDTPRPQPKPQLAIEAEVVDESKVAEEMRKLQQEEERKQQQRLEEEQRAEEIKREREAEEQRLEEVRKQRAEEEEAERLRAEQRKAEEAERAAQEAKRKAAETKTAEAKAAADKKRKDEAARKKAEAELRRRVAEEEARASAIDAGLLAQYIAQIQGRIQRAWIRPPSARAGLNCVVYVTQDPSGEVVSVRVGECNGDDIVRQSIEAAVHRASPLPLPSDPSLFERNLRLNFKPDE